MIGNRTDVAFSGDLTDPWVRAIRDAIPAPCSEAEGPELPDPDSWPPGRVPDTWVLHRGMLSVGEADRLRRLRATEPTPRVILVAGPHARYHQLMSWSGLVDLVLPEATAAETIARVLGDPSRTPPRPSRAIPVALASRFRELARVFEEALLDAGYAARHDRDDPSTGGEPWVVWDVPVLDPDWPTRLARAAEHRGVVALLGLADRPTVRLAREAGAVACLDLPCDPDDLIFVLDRLTSSRRPSATRRDPRHAHRRSFSGRGSRSGTR